MNSEILARLGEICAGLGLESSQMKLDFPEDMEMGDLSSNIALANAKRLKMDPANLAKKIVSAFNDKTPAGVAGATIAGPGFINFKLKDGVFFEGVVSPMRASDAAEGAEKVLVEYTDPNTFKVFHIGHLMSNAIGESISRLIESSGSKVVRICYPSDIGLHIAKSIWALQKHIDEMPSDDAPIVERTAFLGRMYVEGTNEYEKDPGAKDDIDALNKVIYEGSSKEIDSLYQKGRKWSVDHFERLYNMLGTKFDEYIYESEMAPIGLDLVKEYAGKGVFEESKGAIVFKGEKYGLHTRVFINSQGLPTYEAKDVGLNLTKFKKHPDADLSVIVTGSEQNDYFKVIIKAISLIDEKDGKKTKHIGHGMLRFASGKMSSRTGKVITAEALIDDIKALVKEKIADRGFSAGESDSVADDIAVGAIKYTILRSSIGSDIVFDSAASISFEGDSGPYLQYSAVRAGSILKKATEAGVDQAKIAIFPEKAGNLERMLWRFAAIMGRARKDLAPQMIAGYLTSLAGVFNSYYASQTIIDEKDPLSPYRVALVRSFRDTMERGLDLLGIRIPEKM